MTKNLNVQPLTYDFLRVRYSPKYLYDCAHCHTPLESLRDNLMLIPGNFHHPGMAGLLCGRCTKLFWDREERADKAAQEAGS